MRIKVFLFLSLILTSSSLYAQSTPTSFFNCLASYITPAGNKLYLKNTIKPNQLTDAKKKIWNLSVTDVCTSFPALKNAWVSMGANNEIQYLRFEFTPNKGEIVAQFDPRSQLAIYAQINRSVEKVAFFPFRINNQSTSMYLTYVLVLKNEQYVEAVTFGAISNAENDD